MKNCARHPVYRNIWLVLNRTVPVTSPCRRRGDVSRYINAQIVAALSRLHPLKCGRNYCRRTARTRSELHSESGSIDRSARRLKRDGDGDGHDCLRSMRERGFGILCGRRSRGQRCITRATVSSLCGRYTRISNRVSRHVPRNHPPDTVLSKTHSVLSACRAY